MGWFGRLFGNSVEDEIEKRGIKTLDKMAQSDERIEALSWLNKEGSQRSLLKLFQRFDFKHEKMTEDEEEKTWVYDALLDRGSGILDALKLHVQSAQSLSWPLRLLSKIATDTEQLEIVKQICDKNPSEYARDVTKKMQLISWMGEHPDANKIEFILPYFNDPSEEVRFTAIDALLQQPLTQADLEKMLEVLVSPNEDSRRIKLFIMDEFHRKKIIIPTKYSKSILATLERYGKRGAIDSLGHLVLQT